MPQKVIISFHNINIENPQIVISDPILKQPIYSITRQVLIELCHPQQSRYLQQLNYMLLLIELSQKSPKSVKYLFSYSAFTWFTTLMCIYIYILPQENKYPEPPLTSQASSSQQTEVRTKTPVYQWKSDNISQTNHISL